MTTVCYRDGILAADSQVTDSSIIVGTVRKFDVLPDGGVVCTCGRLSDQQRFFDWIVSDKNDDKKPKVESDFEAVHIGPGGEIMWYGSDLQPYQFDHGGYWSIGSGFQLAMGAMAHGATAEEACRIACKHDIGSSEPVLVHNIQAVRVAAE